jgi:hypothetical protein
MSPDWMVISAVEYLLPRNHIEDSQTCCAWLTERWKEFSPELRNRIRYTVEMVLTRDSLTPGYPVFNCDAARAPWTTLRDLWIPDLHPKQA